MRIRYVSDLHLDWDKTYRIPVCEDDINTTLVIAGDLWTDCKHLTKILTPENKSWLAITASQFKYVVYVLGNHDYWNTRLDSLPEKCNLLHKEQGLDNVFLLENSTITLDGVVFAGGTLWTDYGSRNPISMMEASHYMNDYRLTRVGREYHKMKPSDCLTIFDKTKKTIFNSKADVVVTHMAPSHASVDCKYRNERDALSNTWYYSELSNSILDSKIRLWIHGHMHSPSDYNIGDTNIVCNPKGYVGEGVSFDARAYKILNMEK